MPLGVICGGHGQGQVFFVDACITILGMQFIFSRAMGAVFLGFFISPAAQALTCEDPALLADHCGPEIKTLAAKLNVPFESLTDSFINRVSVYAAHYEGTEFKGAFGQPIRFSAPKPGRPELPTFELNPDKEFQTMRGFGASLTESCAVSLLKLPKEERRELMEKMFSPSKGAGFNLIRMPVGASDFALSNYTYNDTPGNRPDPSFKSFDMSRDEKSLALLREAKEINPDLEIMITPWSAPAWMKTNGAINAGSLKPEHYQDFANYFVKVIKGYEQSGLKVESLTPQNEPYYATPTYPSMEMTQDDQIKFIGQYLGPTLRANGLSTKIFGLDHNWDMPDVAHGILEDKKANEHMQGIAYHCYGGSRWAMSETIAKYPTKEVIQTECTASGLMEHGNPSGDFQWWLENHSVAAVAQGTTGTLGWNLCLDQNFGPQNGGCAQCRGMVTIDTSNNKVTLNPEFQAVAQVSKFVPKGAKRLELKGGPEGVHAVAFRNPDGKMVFVAQNPHDQPVRFRLRASDCRTVDYEIAAKGAVTFSW